MAPATALELTLLPGARALLAAHARELPQRDDLCGAFCGALALDAAGLRTRGAEPLDQDAVALAAGTVVSASPDPSSLPAGERSRRDYRLSLPFVHDALLSGTTAAGLVHAIEALSDERLAAIPLRGPWTPGALDGLFALAVRLAHAVTLLANLATRHLWGSAARPEQMLAYLLEGDRAGPAPDWDVGHFACVVARVRGPGGRLYCLADTYPSLGNHGVHVQPEQNLAAAIERRDKPAGGMIVVVSRDDAPAVRRRAGELGLAEGAWDNGTVTREALA
jgi:Family of unknown function (DUF6885)